MIDEVALNPRFGGILVRACGKVTLASMLSALAAGIVHGDTLPDVACKVRYCCMRGNISRALA